MKSPLKIGLNLLTLGLISMGIYYSYSLYATGIQTEGYRKESALEYEIIDTPSTIRCKQVRNPSGNAIFIPTNTETEWDSFSVNAPGNLGVSIADCVTPSVDTGNPTQDGRGDGGSCGTSGTSGSDCSGGTE